MVAFYKDLDKPRIDDWTGASREPNPRKVDTSLGDMFKDVANLFGDAVGMMDRAQTDSIDQAARNSLEPVRDDVIENTPTTNPGAAEATVQPGENPVSDAGEPDITAEDDNDLGFDPAAKGTLDNIATLKSAVGAGHPVGDYYARLNAEVKKLRAMYPGAPDKVDRAVSKILGFDPANALARHKLNELYASQKAQVSAAEKIRREYIQHSEFLPVGTSLEQYATNRDKFISVIADEKQKRGVIDADLKALNYAKARGEYSKDEEEGVYRARVGNLVRIAIRGTFAQLAEQGRALAAKGTNVTAEEIAAAYQQGKAAIDEIRRGALDMAHTIPTDSNGRPLRSHFDVIGDEKIKTIIDNSVAPLNDLLAMYTQENKNGYAHIATNVLSNWNDRALIQLTKEYPEAVVIGGLRKLLGDPAIGVILEKNLPLLNSIQQSANAIGLSVIMSSKPGNVPSFEQVTTKLPTNQKGTATRVLAQQLKEIIKTSTDPEKVKIATEALYGDPKFLSNLKSAQERKIAYDIMADPTMYAKIKAAGPEHEQYYTDWLEKNFSVVSKDALDTLQKDVVQFNRFDVTFDPKTLSFVATPRPGYEQQTGSFPNDPQEYIRRNVGPINSAIQKIAPVLQEKYGDQAPTKLLELLGQQNLNLQAPKGGTAVEQLGDAIYKGLGFTPPNRTPSNAPPQQPSAPAPTPRPNLPAPTGIGPEGRRPEQRSEAPVNQYVFEEQGKKASIRKGRLATATKTQLARAAERTGVKVEVYSGGQRMKGAPGATGSHRHNDGKSGDVKLFVEENGKRRYLSSANPDDKKKIAAFITNAVAAGATGIGHGPGYIGDEGIHVGGGTPAVWGAKGSSKNAPAWVKKAYLEGMKQKQTSVAMRASEGRDDGFKDDIDREVTLDYMINQSSLSGPLGAAGGMRINEEAWDRFIQTQRPSKNIIYENGPAFRNATEALKSAFAETEWDAEWELIRNKSPKEALQAILNIMASFEGNQEDLPVTPKIPDELLEDEETLEAVMTKAPLRGRKK